MYYYFISEPATLAILYAHADPYLISALNAGVLDCEIKICDRRIYERILAYGSGIVKQTQNDVESFNLDDYPDIKKKRNLIEMRAPVFQLLIEKLHLANTKNILGFSNNTPQVIASMLTNSSRITEYATTMKITPEFALSELKMLSDSMAIDNFRIFTLSMFWQKRINQCETTEDAQALLEPIRRSFWSAGIPHV
jgi:hypothetical protein